jgi:hypothetical protein
MSSAAAYRDGWDETFGCKSERAERAYEALKVLDQPCPWMIRGGKLILLSRLPIQREDDNKEKEKP